MKPEHKSILHNLNVRYCRWRPISHPGSSSTRKIAEGNCLYGPCPCQILLKANIEKKVQVQVQQGIELWAIMIIYSGFYCPCQKLRYWSWRPISPHKFWFRNHVFQESWIPGTVYSGLYCQSKILKLKANITSFGSGISISGTIYCRNYHSRSYLIPGIMNSRNYLFQELSILGTIYARFPDWEMLDLIVWGTPKLFNIPCTGTWQLQSRFQNMFYWGGHFQDANQLVLFCQ